MTPLLIFGAGGHGKSVLDVALACGRTHIRIFDDQLGLPDLLHLPVEDASHLPCVDGIAIFEFIVAVGDNHLRKAGYERLRKTGALPATLIHPSAWVSPHARIGAGTVIMGGAIINASARIGDNCIINTAASVDHDCIVGNDVQISPHACLTGDVRLGEGVMIGAGVIIVPGRTIGPRTVIGAGAVVTCDLPGNVRAWGVPARIISD